MGGLNSDRKRVFVSYSSRDRVEAFALKQLIEGQGHDVWMDLFDIQPAAKLAAELRQGVQSADVLCILLSPTAVASRWVRDEIEHARAAAESGVKILPVVLRPAEIPASLADMVAIDATRGLDDPTVAIRLQQFFGGDVSEGIRLDAFRRSELADRAARDAAEESFPELRRKLERVWDQPLRELTLKIDQNSWPEAEPSVLEIVIEIDMFQGSAHILLAPYVEGATWRADARITERPADDFFGAEMPRVDARFLWVGRELVLPVAGDGPDLGEQPLAFSIKLDGKDPGEKHAGTMQLVEHFELPPLRHLVERGSQIRLWRHAGDTAPAHIDPRTTDLDLELTASVAHDDLKAVCLWSSRHDRAQQVLLSCPTLVNCATDVEREVVLSTYHHRSLRSEQTSTERRVRITTAVDNGEPIPAEDRWAALHLLQGRGNLLALRRARGSAAEAFHAAVNTVIESFDESAATYEQFFALWHCVTKLVQLLADGGQEDALRHYLELVADLPRVMQSAHPHEPDYVRARAMALALRAEILHRRFQQMETDSISQAVELLAQLARDNPLPWRIAEAEKMRRRLAALEPQAAAMAAPVPVYARWLDPDAAVANETPVLLSSALPSYSAKLSPRAGTGDRRLHLIDDELFSVHASGEPVRWFSVSCREPRHDDAPTLTADDVRLRAPVTLLHPEPLELLAWDLAPTGALAGRLSASTVLAGRALLATADHRTRWRVYVVRADGPRLRWTISLGFPAAGDSWQHLVADDAAAAIAFRSLTLGT